MLSRSLMRIGYVGKWPNAAGLCDVQAVLNATTVGRVKRVSQLTAVLFAFWPRPTRQPQPELPRQLPKLGIEWLTPFCEVNTKHTTPSDGAICRCLNKPK
jgi:hypothetical protein